MQDRANIQHICITKDTTLREILKLESHAKQHDLPAGIAIVTNKNGQLVGIVTNGDIRRALLKYQTLDIVAKDIMNPDPIYFDEQYSYQDIMKNLPSQLGEKHRFSKKYLEKIVLVNSEKCPIRVIEYHQLWEQRVATHRHIIILGMGYVGLTLALALAERGYQVTGIDVDEKKIEKLKGGKSYIHERGINDLLKENINKTFKVSVEIPDSGDVYIIAVGTPIEDLNKTPVLTYLESAADMVGKKMKSGSLVILRSTVPLGTTCDIVKPILERESGLKSGDEYHLAFAPERTLEGNAIKELYSLPQIIGGINEDSVESTAAIFRELTSNIVRVGSCEEAEFAKLINNCFRDVIFSFSNQMAKISYKYNINITRVIEAANRGYPRDKVPFPSPGVGGPCLTKDPYILHYSAMKKQIDYTICKAGRHIHESMYQFIVAGVKKQLMRVGKQLKGCNILICGLAFKGKPETGDFRNSSSVEIARLLLKSSQGVFGHDPVLSINEIKSISVIPQNDLKQLGHIDVIMFLNNHSYYETIDIFQVIRVLNAPAIIFDAWNLYHYQDVIKTVPCVYMGLGFSATSVNDKNIPKEIRIAKKFDK